MKLPKFLYYAAAAVFSCPSLVPESNAAGLSRATVTNIQKEVWIVPQRENPRAASVGSVVTGSTAVRTGVKSLAEITFSDRTLLRLGSNTQFSFQEGLREVNLRSGTALFQVPKGSGGLRVRTGSVTAAITGSEAKVKAPTPGEPGSFLLLNLHGTMKAEFEDSSFAGGDVPKPLPPPRGLAKLFSGSTPGFSVKLKPGGGLYAWIDENGEIISDTVRTFTFDLTANIYSGRLTGSGGGVTPGTEQEANRQNDQKAVQLFVVTSTKPLPGSYQAISGPQPPEQGSLIRDVMALQSAQSAQAARLAAQAARLAAQQAAIRNANQPPNRPPRRAVQPVLVIAPPAQPEMVVVPLVIPDTPVDTPVNQPVDPMPLPFCFELVDPIPGVNCLPGPPTEGGEGPEPSF